MQSQAVRSHLLRISSVAASARLRDGTDHFATAAGISAALTDRRYVRQSFADPPSGLHPSKRWRRTTRPQFPSHALPQAIRSRRYKGAYRVTSKPPHFANTGRAYPHLSGLGYGDSRYGTAWRLCGVTLLGHSGHMPVGHAGSGTWPQATLFPGDSSNAQVPRLGPAAWQRPFPLPRLRRSQHWDSAFSLLQTLPGTAQ